MIYASTITLLIKFIIWNSKIEEHIESMGSWRKSCWEMQQSGSFGGDESDEVSICHFCMLNGFQIILSPTS